MTKAATETTKETPVVKEQAKPANEPAIAPLLKIDTGLGLDSFINSLATPPVTDEKPAVTEPEKVADVKADVKADTKADVKVDEKKADDKPDTREKQLKDTRDAFTLERQRNVELGRQITTLSKQVETLAKKIDGTYEAEKEPDAQTMAAEAAIAAKVQTSHHAAVDLVMATEKLSREEAEAKIVETVWNPESPYQKLERSDPSIKRRVLDSHAPVIEALKVVREAESKRVYGETPESMRAKIEQELTAQLTEKLTKEITAKVVEGLKGSDKKYVPVKGTGSAAGSVQSPANTVVEKDNFSSLFPSFPAS